MPTAAAASARSRAPFAGNLTMTRVLRSEWTKLRSVRSTWWLLSVTAVITVGVAVLLPPGATSGKPASAVPYTLARSTEYGSVLSQLTLLVLGVLVFTGEYGSGLIRASLSVVPRRLLLLWGKLGAFGAVALALSLASSVAAFVFGELLWQARHGRAGAWFGDRRVERDRCAACLDDLLAHRRGRGVAVRTGAIDVVDHDRGPARGQQPGVRAPQPATRAGHDRHPVIETQILGHRTSSWVW